MVLRTEQVRQAMAEKAIPEFEMRHRMSLALEYASVDVNEMARELEVSRTTISNYLHGRTRPKRPHLVVWALRCGVPFDWLVEGDDIDEDVDALYEGES